MGIGSQGVGQVLRERAAQGDVQHLDPAADAEEGHVAIDGCPHQGGLEGVALAVGLLGLGMRRGPVRGGLEVVAPGEEESVDGVEHLGRVARVGWDDHCDAARGLDLAHVVGSHHGRLLVPRTPLSAQHRAGDADDGAAHRR